MNRTESAYADHLTGQGLAYHFEALKLRLADSTFYTPDFLVYAADGVLEIHEVKGHWEEDARVKIKVAAETFPCFRFLALRKARGGWITEHIPPHDQQEVA